MTETKKIGQFADGIALHGNDQLFLAEASCLFQPKTKKLCQDGFKLEGDERLLDKPDQLSVPRCGPLSRHDSFWDM